MSYPKRRPVSRLGPIVESSIRRVLGASTFQELVRDKLSGLFIVHDGLLGADNAASDGQFV
jgi:hypothetical protein